MVSIPATFEIVRERELDRGFLSPDLLDVKRRPRTNAFAWRGQFTPGLPELLIDTYDSGIGSIYDPFAGSGTTLLEGVRRNRPCVGIEVNPAAYLLARLIQFSATSVAERRSIMDAGRKLLRQSLPYDRGVGLFADEVADVEPADVLVGLAEDASASLAAALEGTLLLSMGDKKATTAARIMKSWNLIESLVGEMPENPVPCTIQLGDARESGLASDSIGLTVTSPPYINVFNYHQNYRPATELLGWQVLPAARSEIGANRKHRGNRFLTVIQYAQDMLQVLREISRVSKVGVNAVFVVGRESRVRGVAFANGEILAVLAELLGCYRFVRWQERKFVNRFGVTIYEEILTFEVQASAEISETISLENLGREVGIFCLDEAVTGAPLESVEDIKLAIANANGVRPSPFAGDLRLQRKRGAALRGE